MAHTVTDVLDGLLPEGIGPHQVTSIVMVCEFVDEETGHTSLAFQRNDEVGLWRHIGMLTVALDEYRADVTWNDAEEEE